MKITRPLLLCTGLVLSSATCATTTQQDIQERVSVEQRLGGEVALAPSLQDERGRSRSLREYLGNHPGIIALVYFDCPNLCTLTLNALATSLKGVPERAGRDYEVLVISIDPREGPAQASASRDRLFTSASMRATRDCAGCDSGWHFLTAAPAEIRAITDSLGYHYLWDPGQRQFAHPAGIAIVSATGRITQYFNGLEFPSTQLRRALSQAAAGQSGTLAERLWLLCFHYDALRGRYSAGIGLALRVLGAATVLCLGAWVYSWSRVRP